MTTTTTPSNEPIFSFPRYVSATPSLTCDEPNGATAARQLPQQRGQTSKRAARFRVESSGTRGALLASVTDLVPRRYGCRGFRLRTCHRKVRTLTWSRTYDGALAKRGRRPTEHISGTKPACNAVRPASTSGAEDGVNRNRVEAPTSRSSRYQNCTLPLACLLGGDARHESKEHDVLSWIARRQCHGSGHDSIFAFFL